MATCRVCKEPIIFLPIAGWMHVTLSEFEHEAEVSR